MVCFVAKELDFRIKITLICLAVTFSAIHFPVASNAYGTDCSCEENSFENQYGESRTCPLCSHTQSLSSSQWPVLCPVAQQVERQAKSFGSQPRMPQRKRMASVGAGPKEITARDNRRAAARGGERMVI